MDDLGQEVLGPFILGVLKDLLGRALLGDHAAVHKDIEALPDAKHIFSHIEWRMKAYRIRVASLEEAQTPELLFVERRQSEKNYAIPSAFGAYVKYMKEEIV